MAADIQSVEVIELWPIVSSCWVCGEPSYKQGIPVYEGDILPNDWEDEWGGVAACPRCFEKQAKLHEPMSLEDFRKATR